MEYRDVCRVPLEAEQDFTKFLRRVRKEEHVNLAQLAEGLMTASQLARIEKGQRPIPKNMRDRLMGRLGVASDMYENLLNMEDYTAWEQQRNILCAIDQKESQDALLRIAEYEQCGPANDRIRRQFCLMMRAEVLRLQNADRRAIAACYEAAVKCTIPDINQLLLEKKLLSISELNLILEYESYHKGADYAQKCRRMMAFVEHSMYDDLSKVKIYPKIAYYYLQDALCLQGGRRESLEEELRICNDAVEMLRDTGRAFFLLELLETRITLLDQMGKAQSEDEHLRQTYQDSVGLAELLKHLSEEYGVPAYMQSCTYLYQQRWVFYIGDVLRIRRNMLGLTQKELCAGICSVRTLRRAEKREANMQQGYLHPILRRLGLSKEFQRARLVTNDREVLRLRREALLCRNNRDFERCRELLALIRERVSLEIPENRQYLMELEASLDWREGKISKEEFAAREEEALRCTLNTDLVRDTEAVYLTEMEMSCIRKKMLGLEAADKKKYIEYLLGVFQLNNRGNGLSDCVVMCDYVIVHIASELGDIGEYESAIELDKKVLREDLGCRRVWMLGNILYDILWSETERQKENGQSVDKEKMAEILNQCKILSHFCKQTFYEKFYEGKLHQS